MEKETAEAIGRAVGDNPGVIAAGVAAVLSVLGWLGNRLFKSINARIVKLDERLEAHAELDREQFREISATLTKHGEHLAYIRAKLERS